MFSPRFLRSSQRLCPPFVRVGHKQGSWDDTNDKRWTCLWSTVTYCAFLSAGWLHPVLYQLLISKSYPRFQKYVRQEQRYSTFSVVLGARTQIQHTFRSVCKSTDATRFQKYFMHWRARFHKYFMQEHVFRSTSCTSTLSEVLHARARFQKYFMQEHAFISTSCKSTFSEVLHARAQIKRAFTVVL